MSNWKVDYIRMYYEYFQQDMDFKQTYDLFNDEPTTIYYSIQGYKLGKLLEAVDKLRVPN